METHGHHRFALAREIPETFDQCIKPLDNAQAIDVELARIQHRGYCDALSQLGFELIVLPADKRYPDCAFVEDTAVVIGEQAIITRPGAESRREEVEAVREALTPIRKAQAWSYLHVDSLPRLGLPPPRLSLRLTDSTGAEDIGLIQ